MSGKSGCLFGFLFDLFGGSTPKAEPLPYQRKDELLSKAERSFYGVLTKAIGPERDIFAKVRLADLVSIRSGTKGRQSHLNRIIAKHVDFVICDSNSIRPLLAIELDDSSHGRQDRINRDAFVDQVLNTAGLPLIRIPAKRSYDLQELKETLAAY